MPAPEPYAPPNLSTEPAIALAPSTPPGFPRRAAVTLLMGFASGLPLLLTGSTLQAWLTDEKVDLAKIGLFSLVGLPYTFKFVWAPLLDRYVPPFLGRRRGWLLVAQALLTASIAALAFVQPAVSPALVGAVALAVTFFSATQDINVDAYRREALPDAELGLGSSLYVAGYRVAMLVSGAGALWMAMSVPWPRVFLVMAAVSLVGLLTTLWAPEPATVAPPKTLLRAVWEPLVEFLSRRGALLVLAFVLFYKLGDNLASAMTTPFFLSLGFTKGDIAAIAKTFGMAATIGGGLAGGSVVMRIGTNRALWLFGALQATSILVPALLAWVGKDYTGLVAAIFAENFAAGMGTAAYAAYMAAQTNQRYTATQYALLTSLMGVPRVILASPTGWIASQLGWVEYFLFCAACAIPGLLLLFLVAPWSASPPAGAGAPGKT